MPNEDLIAEITQAVEEMDVTVASEEGSEAAAEQVADKKLAELESGEGFSAEDKAVADELLTEANEKEEGTDTRTADEVEADDEATAEGQAAADEVKEEQEAAPPQISDEVLTRAVQAGMPLETARQFPNEHSLTGIIGFLEQQAEESIAADGPPPIKDPFADMPKLDPDVYEPEVIQMFEKVIGIVKEQGETIQGFQGQQEEVAQASQAAVAREVEQWFDGQVEGLGEDFTEALGTGGYNSLDKGSSQFGKRDSIAREMIVLLAGYEATGRQVPPREQVFEKASKFVLQDEYQKIHEKKLTGDLEKHASQHIQRAGGQKASATETPVEEAARVVGEKFGI